MKLDNPLMATSETLPDRDRIADGTVKVPLSLGRRGFTLAAAPFLAALASKFALTPARAAPAPGGKTEPRRGGTLRINFANDNTWLVSLDPFQVWWIEHRAVLRTIAESLTDQDPATGEIIPWLATSWAIGGEGREYTFSLRKDVTFSNGEAFDAVAVKTAFDANKEFVATLPSVFGASYLEGYDHAEVIDSHTVKLVLSTRNGGFLQATSTTNLAILAPESYRHSAKERSAGAIIGTGPFILQSYTPEVGVRLVKRKGYAWPSGAANNPGEAYLDAIDVRYVPEESVRNGQFLQGEVDIVWPRDPFAEVDVQLLTSKGGRIASRSLPGVAWNLYPNVRGEGPLADPRVRLAVRKGIDRQDFVHAVFSADYPAVGSVYDSSTPYFKSQADKLAYDPAGAARLLEEAGWKVGKDGTRSRNGKRLTLNVPISGKETQGELLLQDQLRKIGIDLKLNILVLAEQTNALRAGKYDIALDFYKTRGDPSVLQAVLDQRLASSNSRAIAANAYAPETWEKAKALFDQGQLSANDQERARAYGALQDLLVEENVAIPVYDRLWQATLSAKVQGFDWTAEGFVILNDVWKTS
jgi:peptide/nickel transport system substrate-binding protein